MERWVVVVTVVMVDQVLLMVTQQTAVVAVEPAAVVVILEMVERELDLVVEPTVIRRTDHLEPRVKRLMEIMVAKAPVVTMPLTGLAAVAVVLAALVVLAQPVDKAVPVVQV